MTHFFLYLEQEKRYDIEILSIDRVLDEEHFHKKIMPKPTPRLLFNFGE